MQLLPTLKKSRTLLSIVALTTVLSGCSIFGDDDEEIKVAPLQPINSTINASTH